MSTSPRRSPTAHGSRSTRPASGHSSAWLDCARRAHQRLARTLLMPLRRHAGCLDHRSDAGDLALDELLQGGGAAIRAFGRRAAELDVTLLNRGIIERLAERVRELCDDLIRCALGSDHAVPGAEDEVD